MSSENKNICSGLFVLVLAAFSCIAKGQSLTFVSARNHILGGFVGNQAVYADKERIYAGSFQGDLFVLLRDKETRFPLIETISFGPSLVAVRGDEVNLYVLLANGKLWTLKKSFPLEFTSMIDMPGIGAESFALVGKQMYASTGQGEMVADDDCVYLSPLNPGDVVVPLRNDLFGIKFSRMRTYGQNFLPNATTVYSRSTGAVVGSIPNPIQNQQVALYSDETRIFQTVPGPFGTGIWIHQKSNLNQAPRQISFIGANTVSKVPYKGKDLLVAGSEGGRVHLYNLALSGNNPLVGSQGSSCVDLPDETGLHGEEDIEVRSLWCDGIDSFVFAGSSWGNGTSQNPELPSLFVLEVK